MPRRSSLSDLYALSAVFCLLLALGAPAALAQDAPGTAEAAGPASSGSASAAADSLLPAVMGPAERLFWGERGLMRRLGMALTEENREKEIGLRRGLLTAHQAGGFLTLAAMTATAVTGQQIINGRDDLDDRKSVLVTTTIVSYFLTAALAAAAPPPMIRRPQWSSISWHKALAGVHFTGMLITPILGRQIDDDRDRATLHQVAGYATLAAFTGAMLVVTF